MTSINSVTTSSTNTSGYTAKGFSGLVSGMDTEEIVEAMTSDVQAKIDKVKQEQQKNTWKQDAYRTVINSLTSFQDKYFSYASPSTNLLSSSLYNCSKKISQGSNADKINVTSTSNSIEAPYEVLGVKQIATRASYIGNSNFGGNTISTGTISFGDTTILEGKSIEIKYDNQTYTVELPESMSLDKATTEEEKKSQALAIKEYLNDSLKQVSLEGSTGTLGERLEFDVSGTELSLKTKSSTDSRSFEISGGDTDALTSLGLSIGDSGSANNPITGIVDPVQTKSFEEALIGKKLTFEINGLKKTIEFDSTDAKDIANAGDDSAKNIKMAEIINHKLTDIYGTEKIISATAYTAYKVDKEGNFLDSGGNVVADEANAALDTKLNFVIKDSASIFGISSTTSDTMGESGIFAMSNNSSNRIDLSKSLADLGIEASAENEYKITVNNQEFTFKGTDQISTVLNKINSNTEAGVTINYLSTTNKISITADEYGAAGKIDIKDNSGKLAQMLFGTTDEILANTKEGKNLEMTVQYSGDSQQVSIVRNSNSVSLDGINFNVEGEFGTYLDDKTVDTTASESITFKNESDTEDTIKAIKSMAEDYNKILDTINELVSTKSRGNKKNQSTYEPLTDAQKAEMTSDEIEKWETKAKEGILFGDSTLSQLASTLRFAFSSMVGDLGFGKDIGITTASSYSGNGKISIDETKLKEALTNDSEKVKAMFNASEDEAVNVANPSLSGGFATRIKSVFESYAKSTGSYKGKLVQLAGLKNNATTNNNYIDRQQKILDDKLEYLENLLTKRQDRYQSQFSKLETYISNMNAQSAWLSSAFQ